MRVCQATRIATMLIGGVRTASLLITVATFGQIAALPATAAAQTKLLRFPDIRGNEVVFCYGGDLWRASAKGGKATRVTAHPGQELFPKFSPDGKWIAFTGQYDGDEQVYVVSADGGVPKQLTYYPARGPLAPRWGYDNQVYGWTPDGRAVLFRSLRDADGGRVLTALYTVSIEGGLPTKLPMPTSGAGDFSPDGKKIVYSPLFRDFRTWKRYQGGWAQDLYVFDLASLDVRKIAPSKRTERDPMWIGGAIYFTSDRGGTLDLYMYDPTLDRVTQLTHHKPWDVRWASSDSQGQIVYELDGELHVYRVKSEKDRRIAITVGHDGLAMRPSRFSAEKDIEGFQLSPKGERALFVARGDVFTAPIEKGPTRNLTNSSTAHDRHARWSPDGAKIAFISDATGEDQIYLIDQDGLGKPDQLTEQFEGMLYAPEWSPDGRRLAFSDKEGKLYVLTIEDGSVVEVADEKRGLLLDYAWSPHGGHLAFSLRDASRFSSLYIWSLEQAELRRITGPYADESHPVWDPEGNYLFFLASREFAPQMSSVEWNYAGNRQVGVFALALRKDVADPFAPESDEVTVGEEDKAAKDDESDGSAETEEEDSDREKAKDHAEDPAKDRGDANEEDAPKHVAIDFDGLAERVIRVPLEAENRGELSAVKGMLLFVDRGARFYGRSSYAKPALKIFDVKKRKVSTLADDVAGYAVARDGSKVLLRQGSAYRLMDVKPDSKEKKDVSTKGLMVDRVPIEEWATIFEEVWRRYRDFFYVENMHGYDWKAIGERYRAWLPHVAHRSDLNYVIGEMIAELNVGHAYVQGGDYTIPERPKVALPGARFELDPKAGRYRIAEILRGENEEPKYRAPLREVGVDVSEGEYVLAIDGEELRGNDNPYRLLQHKTDPVTLTVNGRPESKDAREVTFRPIFDEESLLYRAWVQENLEKVTQATGGRVGYLHVPDMGGDGIYEFIKWFYPQIRQEGLIVDVRSNGGGNVSQWIIERLDSKLLGTRFGSTSDDPGTYPETVFHGHMVCILNQTSASDGDIFPYRFRQAGLGPLIGMRSWGGVVGISGRGPLLDGGQVYVPLSATNGPDGKWIIEGHGVDPDIEVENDPKSVIQGRDAQLDRAIEEVLERMKKNPKRLPDRPADPVKTR
ncbi:MAG: PD40 domain-containing protein [Pirellulales bacterium]|nr:PD40 domain-containing protein [Pirellulales bacterium]